MLLSEGHFLKGFMIRMFFTEIKRLIKNKPLWIIYLLMVFLGIYSGIADNEVDISIETKNIFDESVIVCVEFMLFYGVVYYYLKKSGVIADYINFGYRREKIYLVKLFSVTVEECILGAILMIMLEGKFVFKTNGFHNIFGDGWYLLRIIVTLILIAFFCASIIVCFLLNSEVYLAVCMIGGILMGSFFVLLTEFCSFDKLPIIVRYSFLMVYHLLVDFNVTTGEWCIAAAVMLFQIIIINIFGVLHFRKYEIR